jgi:DNA helicase-2/ATP-dependent DNA helicase PcrA
MGENDILKELNEVQRQAVEATDGPVMVIAGAGSGKTRVLTYRVAYLLSRGIDPFNTLALTFTNKAAREMKDRIIRLVGSADARNVWMGTFHSIFSKVLRIESEYTGYPSNYTIYDADDSKRLVKSVIKDLQLDDKVYTPGSMLYRISGAKTSLITAHDYNANDEILTNDRLAGKPEFGKIYLTYQRRLFKASAMDFDDLLLNTYLLLTKYPEMLLKYQNKFRYILVDEYQDTNHAQYMIIKKLAAKNENICVVGDDAQSIYGFRGANIQNILNFRHDYPDLKMFKLEQNYRSTQNIVKAANSIIVNNKDQIFKEIWTHNESGNLITVLRATTDNEEGTLVANSIFETKMNNQLHNNDFAVLYRTNAQSRAIEEALRRINIPYRVYGGTSFYNRKEIKDILAYFRLAVNHKDEEALLRIINCPARGIGNTTLDKLIVAGGEADVSLWEVLEEPSAYGLVFNAGTREKLGAFVTMIRSFTVQLKTRNAFTLARHIIDSVGIVKSLREDGTPEGISRVENVEELLNAIRDFSEQEAPPRNGEWEEEEEGSIRTLDEFMQEIALVTDADVEDKEGNDKVALMTVHSAKGLEFPYVFVTGMEENVFPVAQSLNSRAELEEERRLFYVAVTRAMKRLTLSYAENRYRWGNLQFSEPSRFLNEIDREYIDQPVKASPARAMKDSFEPLFPEPPKKKAPAPRNLKKMKEAVQASPAGSYDETTIGRLQTGMEVEHSLFGRGKIISMEGVGPNRKATVFFPGVGQKQLLLRFARLGIVQDEDKEES